MAARASGVAAQGKSEKQKPSLPVPAGAAQQTQSACPLILTASTRITSPHHWISSLRYVYSLRAALHLQR